MKSKRSKATDIPEKVKRIVWERDGGLCIICKSPMAMPNAHYIRRSRDGLGIPENIVTLCTFAGCDCHRRYDEGTEHEQEELGAQIKAYLQEQYPDWNESKLYYSKY